MISFGLYPKMRSALWFQSVMIPFKVFAATASLGGLNYRGQAHGCRLCALALGDVKRELIAPVILP